MSMRSVCGVWGWHRGILIIFTLLISSYVFSNENKDEFHKAKEIAKCFGIELAVAEYMESKNVKSGADLLRLRAGKYRAASFMFFVSSGVPLEKAEMAVLDYAEEANISYAAELESGFALHYKPEVILRKQTECYKTWGSIAAAAADVIKENSYK